MPASEIFKEETTTLRIVSIFVVFVVSALGCAVPYTLSHPSRGAYIRRLTKCFSAGIVAGVGFIHTLGDSAEKLGSVSSYPWTYAMAMAGCMLMLFVTQVFDAWTFKHHHQHKQQPSAKPAGSSTTSAPGEDEEKRAAEVGEDSGDILGCAGPDIVYSFMDQPLLIAYILELGMVTHSVLIGVGLGVITEGADVVRMLLIALSVHQFFEGMGLATALAEAQLGRAKTIGMIGLYSVTTSVGIAIGLLASTTYNEGSPTAAWVEGSLNALSSGMLIYLSIVDMMLVEFAKKDVRGKIGLQMQMFACMTAGAVVMAVLAIWA